MATITGVNIYIDGVKHNSTPQPLTQATYDISNVKAAGAAFDVQFSYTYDDATESQLTAIQSYSLVSGIISLQTLTFEASSYVIGSDYNAFNIAPNSLILHPRIQYRNGNTLAGSLRGISTDNRAVITQHTPNGIRPPFIIAGATDAYNRHDQPVIHYEGDRLYFLQEANHNLNPVEYHKTQADNDSLIIDSNVGNIGSASTYPNIYRNNGKIAIICQILDVEAGLTINQTGNIESIWDATLQWITRDSDETERYQMSYGNKSLEGDIVVFSCGRNDSVDPANPIWFRGNLFRISLDPTTGVPIYKTFDGTVIYTGTQPIDTAGVRQAEMYDIGSTNQGYIPFTDLDQNGNFYAIRKDEIGDYILSIWNENNAAPTHQVITFPDSPTLIEGNPNQNHAVTYMITISANDIQIFVKVNNGTRIIVRHYKSIDAGVNWTVIQDIDFGFDVLKFAIPVNYLDIPIDSNFASFATGTADQSAIKRAAFGGIQVETNIYDGLTPISESAYNSTSILSYFIESGKITNTGTILDSVIDQSINGNNIIPTGSPQLDDGTTPTEVIMDGVNDGFDVDPTLIQANKDYLIIGVTEYISVPYNLFTFTNNSNDDSFVFFQITNVLRMIARYNESTIKINAGDEATPNGYNISAWLIRGARNSPVMYLNGKMQERVIESDPTVDEGKYMLPNGITNIGILKNTRLSTSYEATKMKHFAIHEVNSEAEVLDIMKYLGDKYSMTLNNLYR